MLKVKENNEYKNVDLVYSGETEIEQIYDKNGNLVFDANNEIEDETPISFQGKKSANLKNYRIYGQTSRNLFNGFSIHGKVPSVSNGELVNSSSAGATTDLITIDTGDITLSKDVAAASNMYIFLYSQDKTYIGYTQTSSTSTLTLKGSNINGYQNAKYARIRVDVETAYSQANIMLNTGSTPLPYEPYGESVGDRTGNFFYKKIENANISSRGGVYTDVQFNLWIGKVTAGETYTARNMNLVVGFFTDEPDFGVYTYNNSRIADASPVYTFTVPSGCSYVAIRFFKNEPTFMLNSGSTPLPYEPYRYKVPVTVSNGTDTLTTPIYLPEPIKMVGDEAEYIDYAEQKLHRVRKNLFDINNLEDHYDISIETGLPTRDSAYSYLRCAITTPINVSAGDYYLTFNKNIAGEIGFIVSVFENNTLISRTSGYYSGARIRIPSGNNIYIGFHNQNVAVAIHPSDISNIMLNSGAEPLPYEPYITNTELDVTLPALPVLSGTNTLTVGTAVQPSDVYIKGKIKTK